MKKFLLLIFLNLISVSVYSMEVFNKIPTFYWGTITNNTDKDVAIIDGNSNKVIAKIDHNSSKTFKIKIHLKDVDHTWFKKYRFQHKEAAISMEIEHEMREHNNRWAHNSNIFLYYKNKLGNPKTFREWHKHNYRYYEGENYLINVVLEGAKLRESHLSVRSLGQPTMKEELKSFER